MTERLTTKISKHEHELTSSNAQQSAQKTTRSQSYWGVQAFALLLLGVILLLGFIGCAQ